jgi:hypothetical protein
MNGIPAQDSKLFPQNLFGLSECGETQIFCAILTFAILFYPSVVFDEEKHLDENHQKLAIPAGYVEDGGKREAHHDGGPFHMMNWIFKR